MKRGWRDRKRGHNARGNQQGMGVITAAFLIAIFATLGMASVAILSGSTEMMVDEYRSQQAVDVANAGIAYISEQLSGDSDWSDNAGVTKSFNPGSFTITYEAKSTNSATVRSAGTVEGITRTLEQSLSRGSGTTMFACVLYSQQTISNSGSSSGTVTGTVRAGSSIATGSGVTFNGSLEPNRTTADIPDPDWTYWLDHATTVYTENHTFSAGTYDGIYYVTGNVNIQKDVVVNGTIVARGDINVSSASDLTVTASGSNPALISEGSLSITGSSTVNVTGWAVSQGNLTVNGNSGLTVSGGLGTVGALSLSGNTNLSLTHTSPPSTVPGFSGGETYEPVLLVEWKEVY